MSYAPTPIITRLLAKVEIVDDHWLFLGSRDKQGYGRIGVAKHKAAALVHRVSYEHYHGPILPGLVVDHLCFVYNCVNPDHLEAVTHQENARRRNDRHGWISTV